jgi:hypothetical protein
MFVQAQAARSAAVVIGQPSVVNIFSMTHVTWTCQYNAFKRTTTERTEQFGIIPSMETTGVVGVIFDCAMVAVTNKHACSSRKMANVMSQKIRVLRLGVLQCMDDTDRGHGTVPYMRTGATGVIIVSAQQPEACSRMYAEYSRQELHFSNQ